MNLALKIEAARKARGLSRKELADKVKRSEHTVKAWEIGRNRPSKHTLQNVELALGLRSGELCGGPLTIQEALKQLEITLNKIPPQRRDHAVKLISNLTKLIENN